MKQISAKQVSAKQVSIAEAKNHFTALVRDVEGNQVVEVTRRGKPVMMMVSIEQYEALTQIKPSFADALDNFMLTMQDGVGIDNPDELFERDKSVGREVVWT